MGTIARGISGGCLRSCVNIQMGDGNFLLLEVAVALDKYNKA